MTAEPKVPKLNGEISERYCRLKRIRIEVNPLCLECEEEEDNVIRPAFETKT